MRSGFVYIVLGYLWHAGDNGFFWPSTAADYTDYANANAYRFDFREADVYPSSGPDVRFYGFPLRCLAD